MNRIPLIIGLALTLLFRGCATQKQSTANLTVETHLPKGNALSSRPNPVPLIQTGRYPAITATPTEAQINLLRVIISVTLPEEVITVEQAIRHLLHRSGYRLAAPGTQPTAVGANR